MKWKILYSMEKTDHRGCSWSLGLRFQAYSSMVCSLFQAGQATALSFPVSCCFPLSGRFSCQYRGVAKSLWASFHRVAHLWIDRWAWGRATTCCWLPKKKRKQRGERESKQTGVDHSEAHRNCCNSQLSNKAW